MTPNRKPRWTRRLASSGKWSKKKRNSDKPKTPGCASLALKEKRTRHQKPKPQQRPNRVARKPLQRGSRLAVKYTDEKRYFVAESSVYRILSAEDLISLRYENASTFGKTLTTDTGAISLWALLHKSGEGFIS